jgi:hypothetical protein
MNITLSNSRGALHTAQAARYAAAVTVSTVGAAARYVVLGVQSLWEFCAVGCFLYALVQIVGRL